MKELVKGIAKTTYSTIYKIDIPDWIYLFIRWNFRISLWFHRGWLPL